VTLEQAGFEIRDQIMWIYSSGFPKSQDVGRQLHKKAHGKPDKQRFDKDEMEIHYSPGGGSNGFGSLAFSETQPAKNAQTTMWRHKVNGKIYKALPDINGDRLAVAHEGEKYGTVYEEVIEVDNEWSGWGTQLKPAHEPIALARKPISEKNIAKNCEKWGTGAINIDATRVKRQGEEDRFPSNVIGEIEEEYQKYFYCPKVSRRERHVGFDDVPDPLANYAQGDVKNHPLWDPSIGTNVQRLKHKILEHNKTLGQAHQVQGAVGNNHPTVKPIELMKYLIKLITPPGGTVLDPFNGSGSTGCAAVELGFEYIGCELDPAYVEITKTRIAAWNKQDTNFEALFSAA
jgi:site-specific DNA-methyltransferase (adenine-specific)